MSELTRGDYKTAEVVLVERVYELVAAGRRAIELIERGYSQAADEAADVLREAVYDSGFGDMGQMDKAETEAERHVYGDGGPPDGCFDPHCEYAGEHRDGDEMFCPHHGWGIGNPCLPTDEEAS